MKLFQLQVEEGSWDYSVAKSIQQVIFTATKEQVVRLITVFIIPFSPLEEMKGLNSALLVISPLSTLRGGGNQKVIEAHHQKLLSSRGGGDGSC